MSKYPNHDIRSWASIRQTSVEVAEAIFELSNGDPVLAEKIWEEGHDEVLPLAFSKTTADQLYWKEQTILRKNI